MKAILALVLVALLVVCAQSKRAPGYTGPIRPRFPTKFPTGFNWKRKAIAPVSAEDDDEESDFWMALAPLAINLIKNKLQKKRDAVDEDDEEADFINWRKIGEVAKNVGKSYLSSKYGINLDEEEEADFINFKNLLKKVGGIALQAGKAYVGNKYGIQLDEEDEEEEADFINWKKVWGVAKDIGKTYINNKYGVQLDQEDDEESDFINWKKIGSIAKDIGKTYLSSKYGINLDEEDEDEEEESDSMDAGSSAASWAGQQVGKGYSQSSRLGPNSFDCSGLIYVAYRNQGITVPSYTGAYPGNLKRVYGEGNLRAGDILYRPGHVAMYVGGGSLVQAANPRKGVVRTSLNDYNRYWGGYTAIYRP